MEGGRRDEGGLEVDRPAEPLSLTERGLDPKRHSREALMERVLSVVNEQLDQLEARKHPTQMVVAKLSPEVRMMALGLRL